MGRSRLRKILDNIASWRFERRMRKYSPRYAELLRAQREARRKHKRVRHIQQKIRNEVMSDLQNWVDSKHAE